MTAGWPAGLAARIAAVAAGELTPAVPRNASTVLLLRDGAEGLEVFLVRRARSMAFAGGMFAFPGGSVEPGDGDWIGSMPDRWSELLAYGEQALARELVGAAVRETLEECGVWLGVGSPPADDRVAGQPVRPELLRPWAHWITPEVEPRRFDTRFFLAALPEGQQAAHRGGEADEGHWARPTATAGLPMLPPTLHTLGELSAFASVAEAFAAPRPIHPIQPAVALVDGQVRVLMPWEEDGAGTGRHGR